MERKGCVIFIHEVIDEMFNSSSWGLFSLYFVFSNSLKSQQACPPSPSSPPQPQPRLPPSPQQLPPQTPQPPPGLPQLPPTSPAGLTTADEPPRPHRQLHPDLLPPKQKLSKPHLHLWPPPPPTSGAGCTTRAKSHAAPTPASMAAPARTTTVTSPASVPQGEEERCVRRVSWNCLSSLFKLLFKSQNVSSFKNHNRK